MALKGNKICKSPILDHTTQTQSINPKLTDLLIPGAWFTDGATILILAICFCSSLCYINFILRSTRTKLV